MKINENMKAFDSFKIQVLSDDDCKSDFPGVDYRPVPIWIRVVGEDHPEKEVDKKIT